jgi:hypothetical protein
MLVGWWAFAGTSLVDPDLVHRHALTIFYLLLFAPPLLRSMIYCSGNRPPISLAGRMATMRWIIPTYDRVLAAPLLGAGVTLALFGCSLVDSRHDRWLLPLGAAAVLLISLGLGPSLRSWRLTGGHRIVPGLQTDSPQGRTVRVG